MCRGVQHQRRPDPRAQMFGVGGDSAQRFRCDLEQQAINHRLVGVFEVAKLHLAGLLSLSRVALFDNQSIRFAGGRRSRNPAGRWLLFCFLILPDHLFYLFAFFCRHFAESAIFFTGGIALFRGEFAPCLQAIAEAFFLFGGKIRVALGCSEQAVLLLFRQVIPLLRQGRKRFLLHWGERMPGGCCRAGRCAG